MRWSAPDVVVAAGRERLVVGPGLEEAARRRHDDVGLLPADAAEVAADLDLARLAAVIAVRRHAGREGGRDLSRVGLLLGSGGVLRHAARDAAGAVLGAVLGDLAGGWRLPERAVAGIDRAYLLAPIGLLSLRGEGKLAAALAARLLDEAMPAPP
jgi:hypothetical protein